MSVSGTQSQMTSLYLKDISLMLTLVSSARESNLEMHLEAEREFLNLVHAFDHVNYARYNSYQHVFLRNEQYLNPMVYQDLSTSGYSVSLSGASFSGIHGDLLTEWFNKETKGTAGPFRSGYSADVKTVNTWIRTSHIHCKMRSEMKRIFRIQTSSTQKEMTPRSIKRHTEHIDNLKSTLHVYQIDLFSGGPAVSLSTGVEIDHSIIKGLLSSREVGHKCFLKFVGERLFECKKSFFDPICKNYIKTGLEKKKKTLKKMSLLQEDCQAFGMLVAKATSLEEAFQFPLTTVPLSISEGFNELQSSDKSALRNHIIRDADAAEKRYPIMDKTEWQ